MVTGKSKLGGPIAEKGEVLEQQLVALMTKPQEIRLKIKKKKCGPTEREGPNSKEKEEGITKDIGEKN